MNVIQAYQFALEPSPANVCALCSHSGVARFATAQARRAMEAARSGG